VFGVAFSPDGQRLVSNASGTLHIWRISDGALLLTMTSVNTFTVAWSPDGRYVTTGFELFDATTGALVRNLPWPSTGDITSVTFNKDGSAIVAGGEEIANTPTKPRSVTSASPMARCWRTSTSRAPTLT